MLNSLAGHLDPLGLVHRSVFVGVLTPTPKVRCQQVSGGDMPCLNFHTAGCFGNNRAFLASLVTQLIASTATLLRIDTGELQ